MRDKFSDSEQRFCVRHLYQNFHVLYKGETLKNQLWAIARSSTIPEWEFNMEKMKSLSKDAYAYLEEIPPNQWCRAFFSDFPKCDILLNNNSEVFNKYILEARELPILSMLEMIRSQIMNRIHTKQEECVKKWSGNICPKIQKKVDKNAELSNTCYILPAGKGVFQVTDKEHQYIVDLMAKHYECRRWQLTGIPCNHAISCLRSERTKPEDVVSFCYSTEKYMEAYGFNIMPVRDKASWVKMNGPKVNPPINEKKVGRPRRCRRKQPHELEGGTKISKHGVQMHCSYCQGVNHNKKGCKKRKEDIKAGKQQASAAPSQQHGNEDFMPLQVMPEVLNSQTSILTNQPSYDQLQSTILSSLTREVRQCFANFPFYSFIKQFSQFQCTFCRTL